MGMNRINTGSVGLAHQKALDMYYPYSPNFIGYAHQKALTLEEENYNNFVGYAYREIVPYEDRSEYVVLGKSSVLPDEGSPVWCNQTPIVSFFDAGYINYRYFVYYNITNGTIEEYVNDYKVDYCVNNFTLKDYRCIGNMPYEYTVRCNYGCLGNKCQHSSGTYGLKHIGGEPIDSSTAKRR